MGQHVRGVYWIKNGDFVSTYWEAEARESPGMERDDESQSCIEQIKQVSRSAEHVRGAGKILSGRRRPVAPDNGLWSGPNPTPILWWLIITPSPILAPTDLFQLGSIQSYTSHHPNPAPALFESSGRILNAIRGLSQASTCTVMQWVQGPD